MNCPISNTYTKDSVQENCNHELLYILSTSTAYAFLQVWSALVHFDTPVYSYILSDSMLRKQMCVVGSNLENNLEKKELSWA
jgi:hypothetical protein